MAKKRKTREQKIISQLRRELASKKETYTYKGQTIEKVEPVIKPLIVNDVKNKLYTYDQSLIKGDILKTVYLGIIFFGIIAVAYWFLH